MSRVLVVSGTGTGVGKTIVAAAVLALHPGRCEYVKAAQTGVSEDVPDVDTIRRLTGVEGTEGARFPAPLSPEAAARHAGVAPVDLSRVADHVRDLEADLVVVEGAGGLLVRFDPTGRTVADLAAELEAPVLVVTSAALGTLNATALTLEALAQRDIPVAGLVIGAWPAVPGLAELSNLEDLPIVAGRPLDGVVPADLGNAPRDFFRDAARRSLSPGFGGTFAETP